MDTSTSEILRKFVLLSGIGLTAGLILGNGAWQTRPAGMDQVTGRGSRPTFYRDVLPILQSHCQNCHRPGEVAPMPLVTYAQTRPWAKRMAAEVAMKMMPPWFADPRFGHFANDSSLTEEQIAIFSAWAEAGAPAGDEHDAPPPRKWAEGWNIPPPDRIVTMPKAVELPPQGEVEYTYEIVPTHFAEDRWVQMSELRPGSRGACASCGGLYSSAGFAVAAACSGGRAIHGIDADRSRGTAAGP